MKRPGRSRADVRAALLLVISIVILYSRTVGFPFASWDDPDNLTENAVLSLPFPAALIQTWTRPVYAAYIPVTRTVWALLWNLTHEPWAFHAANVVVHASNAFGLGQITAVSVVDLRLKKVFFGFPDFRALVYGDDLKLDPVARLHGIRSRDEELELPRIGGPDARAKRENKNPDARKPSQKG